MNKFKNSEYYKSGEILISLEKAKEKAFGKNKELHEERINKYNENPKLCENCHKKLNYDKRKNKFCSSSCSATYNNKKREKIRKIKECKECGKEFYPKYNSQVFCCHKCSIPTVARMVSNSFNHFHKK